jgi:hypothetical protein
MGEAGQELLNLFKGDFERIHNVGREVLRLRRENAELMEELKQLRWENKALEQTRNENTRMRNYLTHVKETLVEMEEGMAVIPLPPKEKEPKFTRLDGQKDIPSGAGRSGRAPS